MPEDVMHNYLDRAITMAGLSNSVSDGNGPAATQHAQDMQMILDIKPKFIGRMAYCWGGFQNLFPSVSGTTVYPGTFDLLTADIAAVHAMDNDIICQAFLCEYVDGSCNGIVIPDYVLLEFGYIIYPDGTSNHTTSTGSLTKYFDIDSMLYADPLLPSTDGHANNPDITQIETKMWYYWLATQYINCGCECIDITGMPLMSHMDNPNGNKDTWDLSLKIRTYATTVARNGAILITTIHQPELGYYDVPSKPVLPNWQRQLLSDYVALGIYYNRPVNWNTICRDGNQPVQLFPGITGSIIQMTMCGISPQGWYTSHNPYILEFDNGLSAPNNDLCGVAPAPIDYPDCYGCDNINWFLFQGILSANFYHPDPTVSDADLKNLILRYTYYALKCLDPYGHLQLPARRICQNANLGYQTWYRANTYDPSVDYPAGYSQQQTIKDLWNGVYASPNGWVYHNFMFENCSNGTYDVSASLVFVGDSQLYYISADGSVSGYIKMNGPYNGGTWVSESPSSAAGGTQVLPKSDLVASPDGTMLLYIGTDSRVHGFQIIDVWTYTYFDFPYDPAIIADSSLIFPTNDTVYYIGIYGSTREVHGFQRSTGIWQTVSPTYAAGSASSQLQPGAGAALAYDTGTNRIYYRTTLGLLAYFTVHPDLWEYTYGLPDNYNLLQRWGIAIQGNLAINYTGTVMNIFFVGLRYGDGGPRVFVITGSDATGWNVISLSNNADVTQASQQPGRADGLLALNNDGTVLAYVGADNSVYIFTFLAYAGFGDINYVVPPGSGGGATVTGLQFMSERDVFVISHDTFIHYLWRLEYQEAYCFNTVFLDYP
jgi:hypothetical protein